MVANVTSDGTVFGVILVDWRLRGITRPFVNHNTRFYLRETSFLFLYLFLRG